MKLSQIRNKTKTALRPLILLFMAVILINSVPASAQQWSASSEEKLQAYEQLIDLQGGMLVVVLKADRKKMTQLKKILANENTKPNQKKKAEKQLKKSMREKKNFHLDLVKSFQLIYTFSDNRFIYDHDVVHAMDGQPGLFLNEDLEYDRTLVISKNQSVYYAREGYSSTDGSRVLSYMVYDDAGAELGYPFPSVKLTDVGPALLYRSIFEGSDYRPASTIVERFDYLLKHRMAILRATMISSGEE